MPYIGNQHNVGDHVNNFKVLDDISSHTATFDGSATSIVSAADDTIRIPEHRFIQGQRVTYTNGGGGNIGGLTSGTAYFISFDTANTIKLATTLANANSNTVINLTAVGSGTSHTLNVAFDGVNTKFKMTHGSGKAARLNNATQINVAINNVIQRPNINSVSFTEGFALEDNHKIVFKIAPTVNDIFWGSIIANTIENFDLRDNEVDNFTGDGSTTEFTLSTIPANNESVIVTIDGALQHPSDKNTTRAYTLIDSIIEFSAAPALNAEIQVRHIGFAGASTNDVSGFYGRTGNVALTSSDNITTGDITPRNINASGIITATTFDGAFSSSVGGSNANFTGIVTAGVFKGGDIEGRNLKITGLSTFTGAVNTQALTATSGTFSGNVSIGGTLTYEDVTNIDSVGIITAQKDIHVGAGVSVVGIVTAATFKGDGDFVDIDVDGHTNLDNVNISGVTTTTGDITIDGLHSGGSSRMLNIGSGNNILRIYENSSQAVQIYTQGNLVLTGATTEIRSKSGSNQLEASFHATNGVKLYHNNNEKLFVNGSGVNITGLTTITQDLDVDGHTNLDNVSIAGVTTITQDLDVDGHTNLDNVSVAGVSTFTGVINANNGILLTESDNKSILLGEHDDMRIRHTGSNSEITDEGTGSLRFGGNNVVIGSATFGVTMATFAQGGAVKLYHNDEERLETSSVGVSIPQDLDVDGHTNLDNVSIAGVTTVSNKTQVNSIGIGIIPIDHHHIHIESANPRVLIRSTGTNSAKILFGDNSSNDPGVIEYDHVNNTMRFNTGNLERLRITGAGDLSLRTTTQNAYLGLTANSTAINTTLGSTAGTNPRLYLKGVGNGQSDAGDVFIGAGTGGIVHIRSAELIKFEVNSDSSTIEGLRIDSNGNVMIGRTSASKKFSIEEPGGSSGVHYIAQIGGSNHVSGYAVGIAFDPEGYQARTKLALVAEGTSQGYSRGKFHFLLDAANDSGEATLSESRLTITDDGRVGINESSPTSQLVVKATTDDNPSIRMYRQSTGGDIAALIWSTAAGNQAMINYRGGGGDTGMQFYTSGTGSSNQRLRISTNGQILQFATAGDNQFVTQRTGNAGSNGDYFFYLFAQNNGGTNVGSMGIVRDTANDDSRIVFSTATGGTNTERLRITSTGNTRIGVPANVGSSTLIDEKQATIGTKHFYTVYHNFSSTNSPLAVNSKIPTNSCGTVEIMAGWANGNGITYKKFCWASSGNVSGCTQVYATGASRYGVSTSVGTPTMSISGDYVNFSFTFSDSQGNKMEKLKIHFEYFNQFRTDG